MNIIKEQGFSLLVATIALMVSIRTCYISEQATSLMKSDLSQERMITLTARVDSIGGAFWISPSQRDITLLSAKAYVTTDMLSSAPCPIDFPNFKLELTPLKYHWAEFVNEHNPVQSSTYKSKIPSEIPVIIQSEYIFKGIRYFDKSLYELSFNCVPKKKVWMCDFQDLVFFEHLLQNNYGR